MDDCSPIFSDDKFNLKNWDKKTFPLIFLQVIGVGFYMHVAIAVFKDFNTPLINI
jgi:hypothetical protein